MIRQILAALDGSETGRAAGRYAAHLAAAFGARARALNVIDVRALEGPVIREFSMQTGLEPFETYTEALRDVLAKQAEEVMARFRADAEELGLPADRIDAVVETGVVGGVICEQAAQADLVVVGQHGQHGAITGGLLGSTAEQIVRRATRPVLVCPTCFHPIERPLVAYDGSRSAATALHVGADVAGQLGVELAVAIIRDDEQMTEVAAHEAERSAREYLAGTRFTVSIVEGYAEQEIVALGASGTFDLIVMGAFGRSRIRELIVGSTTEYVMRKADVPVMLVRN